MTLKYKMICRYCNYTWLTAYLPSVLDCIKCNDHNIRVVDIKRDTVDYYVGCPPFPEDLEEEKKISKPDPNDGTWWAD